LFLSFPDLTFKPDNQASRTEKSLMTENMKSRPWNKS